MLLCDRWDWLEATTGPVMLFHAVEAYKKVKGLSGLTILPPGVIYPIDWRRTVWGPKDGPGVPSPHSHCCHSYFKHPANYCARCGPITCPYNEVDSFESSFFFKSAALGHCPPHISASTIFCAWTLLRVQRAAGCVPSDSALVASQATSSASAIRCTRFSTRISARLASLRPMPSHTGRTPGDQPSKREDLRGWQTACRHGWIFPHLHGC